jgi:predicted kinase
LRCKAQLYQEANRMMKPKAGTLHFVCGKIASGKTTLARNLAIQHSAAMLCEDEWLTLLSMKIESFGDCLNHSRTLRRALAPHVIQLLKLGVSVVLDFPANAPKDREWIRSLFEGANAPHMLHFINAPDELCRSRLRTRNEAKPEGLYWGHVPEADFEAITRHLVPPAEAEGFRTIRYEAQDT